MPNDKYIQLHDIDLDELMARVNAVCATSETVHGSWYSKKPTHKLVTVFPSPKHERFIAILEIL